MTDSSITTDLDTDESTSVTPEGDEGATEDVPGSKTMFGKLTPREAIALRWEKERARQANAVEQAAHEARGIVVVVRVSVPIGEIITKLSAQAKKGDVAAARELRAYMSEAQIETETDLSALDRRTLQAMKARLLQEIADEEGLPAYMSVSEESVETITPSVDEQGGEAVVKPILEGATPATRGTPSSWVGEAP